MLALVALCAFEGLPSVALAKEGDPIGIRTQVTRMRT